VTAGSIDHFSHMGQTSKLPLFMPVQTGPNHKQKNFKKHFLHIDYTTNGSLEDAMII
jgi:hypothetical protein